MRIEPLLDSLAAEAIREALGTDAPALVRPTQDPRHGDYQINGVLPLAKTLKQSPRLLGGMVAERMRAHDAIDAAEVAGPGFVNLRLSDEWIAARLIDALGDRARDGVEPVERGETIVVDFSSPNIAKQMHVGHLRSTILGDAIARLLRFAGHRVIGDNHLGDWGTQFGLLIVGMRAHGSAAALEREPIEELERVYKLASKQAEQEEAFARAARAELAKLQAGDADNRALWARFVEATRRSLTEIYERLDVRFDEWLGESAYDDMLQDVVSTLLDRGIAREDEGAVCVFFGEHESAPEKLRKQQAPFIVRKSDGAYLYSTTDIATILYRRDRFGADRSVYVVDKRQAPHFEQLFAVAAMLRVTMRLDHVGFGMVLGADGKPIRTRAGDAFTLASLLDEAVERAEAKMIEEKKLAPELAHELAPAVGIGAVKYADLCQNRTSDYRFDWDKLIAFEGNAGPYLQYAHARACKLLREGGADVAPVVASAMRFTEPEEASLARRLVRLPDVLHVAAEQYLPHLVTDHIYALAREFSSFYQSPRCPVLRSEGEVRETRIALVDLTRRQLARCLGLLGIVAPTRM